MKRTYTLLAAALLALATSPILADNWDGNAEMRSSILNNHSSGYVGTSYASANPVGQWDGHAELEQSVLNYSRSGFVGTSLSSAKPAGQWDGHAELEQSVINNL